MYIIHPTSTLVREIYTIYTIIYMYMYMYVKYIYKPSTNLGFASVCMSVYISRTSVLLGCIIIIHIERQREY